MLDSTIATGQKYYIHGQSTQAQADAGSVSHGIVSATEGRAGPGTEGRDSAKHSNRRCPSSCVCIGARLYSVEGWLKFGPLPVGSGGSTTPECFTVVHASRMLADLP